MCIRDRDQLPPGDHPEDGEYGPFDGIEITEEIAAEGPVDLPPPGHEATGDHGHQQEVQNEGPAAHPAFAHVASLVVHSEILPVNEVSADGSGSVHAEGSLRYRPQAQAGASSGVPVTAGGQDGTFVAVPALQVAGRAPMLGRARPAQRARS